MEDRIKEKLINNYKDILINVEKRNIDAIGFGFINNNCSSMLLPILIHCMENIEIFNIKQLNNISNFINKVTYGE